MICHVYGHVQRSNLPKVTSKAGANQSRVAASSEPRAPGLPGGCSGRPREWRGPRCRPSLDAASPNLEAGSLAGKAA